MTLFERSKFEELEFDFSKIRPTKQEVASFFEETCSVPQVIDFKYSFSLQEAKIDIDVSSDTDGPSVVETFPEDVTIPYAKLEADGTVVSLDIELADWFRFEDEEIYEQYDIDPPTDTQLRETAAFIQATTEQISTVKQSQAIKLEEDYGVLIEFHKDAEITDTYILNQLREWIGFSYGGFVVTNGTFDSIIITLTQDNPFQVSDCDGFRMNQLRMYEEDAIEKQLIAKLPCGHSSSIKSILFTHYSSDFDELGSVDWDGCAVTVVPVDEVDGGMVCVEKGSEDDFIPVKTAHAMVCSNCLKAYILEEFDEFKETVCLTPRFNQIVGRSPTNEEYSFMFPPVEPVEREYISSTSVSVDASSFDWLLKRPQEEK